MATASGPKYQLLVANFSRPNPAPGRGSDPAISRPTKIRSGFEFRQIQNLGQSLSLTNAPGGPATTITKTQLAQMQPFAPNGLPEADVEVVSDVFLGQSASLLVGIFELVSGRDFVTGGGLAATAANIGTAIDNLPGYSSSVAGAIITVFGPRGQLGLRFDAAYRGGDRNFEFVYPNTTQTGVLGYSVGVKPEEPATILPPASLQGSPA